MKRSLRSWLWRVPIDQEVTDEIALHLELRTRELIARGMDPAIGARARAPSGWATSPSSKKPASTSEESEIVACDSASGSKSCVTM